MYNVYKKYNGIQYNDKTFFQNHKVITVYYSLNFSIKGETIFLYLHRFKVINKTTKISVLLINTNIHVEINFEGIKYSLYDFLT